MKLLLDTQIILWATIWPEELPAEARNLLVDTENTLLFSPASIWEVSIKNSLNRMDFKVDARDLREQLLANGCEELCITGVHAATTSDLPPIHKDPFDRMLLAQALSEGVELLSSDAILARYPAPVHYIHKT